MRAARPADLSLGEADFPWRLVNFASARRAVSLAITASALKDLLAGLEDLSTEGLTGVDLADLAAEGADLAVLSLRFSRLRLFSGLLGDFGAEPWCEGALEREGDWAGCGAAEERGCFPVGSADEDFLGWMIKGSSGKSCGVAALGGF